MICLFAHVQAERRWWCTDLVNFLFRVLVSFCFLFITLIPLTTSNQFANQSIGFFCGCCPFDQMPRLDRGSGICLFPRHFCLFIFFCLFDQMPRLVGGAMVQALQLTSSAVDLPPSVHRDDARKKPFFSIGPIKAIGR